jgi:aromatic-L-amino-acid decarboxylase
MHPDEFRRHAHELVDWIADYMARVGELPVVPEVRPGEIRAQVPTSPPEQGEAFEAMFRDFQQVILPGMTLWNHPGWFAYFPGNNSPPSILGEMLTAALGAQCMSWATSPAATELEQVVMDWLRQMIGLPDARRRMPRGPAAWPKSERGWWSTPHGRRTHRWTRR